ncbi:eif3d, partial [Symbiodinium microadriaticum]
FAVESLGNVFATDAILAQLMLASRSVYSWDLVIQKVNGMLFFDKRENSQFDFLTVSETANEPPAANDETDAINYPDSLSVEATRINQNMSQQFEPNPFYDEDSAADTEPASVAYRYRKFSLGSIELIVRCELHGWVSKRGEDQFMTCYAVNEWDSHFCGGVEWRQKIDQQKGAVLATEIKNNSYKMGKWAAQSILAGADLMQLGYVSRVNRTNPLDHVILATQSFKPKDLAGQIAMNPANMWGVVKMICDLMLNQEDGKYVLLKDPNKAIMRLYCVPLSTFESDEEEEEDDEEEGEDDEDEDA